MKEGGSEDTNEGEEGDAAEGAKQGEGGDATEGGAEQGEGGDATEGAKQGEGGGNTKEGEKSGDGKDGAKPNKAKPNKNSASLTPRDLARGVRVAYLHGIDPSGFQTELPDLFGALREIAMKEVA
ncbi:MAG: hypothetical protein HQL64_10870 [Magnetococcales bacterium]|nr:hypothetical protein [Magnetococcales bacterium]